VKLTEAAKLLGLKAEDVIKELMSGDLHLDSVAVQQRAYRFQVVELERAIEEAKSEEQRLVDASNKLLSEALDQRKVIDQLEKKLDELTDPGMGSE
jgi:hypothetical protein